MIHSTCEQNMEDVVTVAGQIININNLGNVKKNVRKRGKLEEKE